MAPQLISENLDVLTGTKSLIGSVSLTTSHVYEFNLKIASSFNLALTNLDGNADVKLNKGTTTLNQSSNGDRLSESINQLLDPGLYSVEVSSPESSLIDYRLSLTAQSNQHRDLIWRNTAQDLTANWQLTDSKLDAGKLLDNPKLGANSSWQIVSTADFDKDGNTDFLWRNGVTDQTAVWYLNSDFSLRSGVFLGNKPALGANSSWQIVGTADFDKDGNTDFLWRNGVTDQIAVWNIDANFSFKSGGLLGKEPALGANSSWQIVGTADFDQDGNSDLLLRNRVTDQTAFWNIDANFSFKSGVFLGNSPSLGSNSSWQLRATADFNSDGQSDLVWQNSSSGEQAIWYLKGTTFESGAIVDAPKVTDPNWRIVGTAARTVEAKLKGGGTTLGTALAIGALTGSATYQGGVGVGRDSFYQFTLSTDNKIKTVLTAGASVKLLDSSGKELAPSSGILAAGTYYAQVSALTDSTYSLTLSPETLKQFITSSYDEAVGTVIDSAGNVYVTGRTDDALSGNTQAGGGDVYIAKYDSTGSLITLRQFGTPDLDQATGIAIDSAGNVYVTGYTQGAFTGSNAGLIDAFIAKYDTTGNLTFQQFGTADEDYATSIAIDGAGNVYVTGNTNGAFSGTNAGGSDVFIARYGTTGGPTFQQFGTASNDYADGIATSGASVYVTGSTYGSLGGNSAAGNLDAFIAKYDIMGGLLTFKQFGTADYDETTGIAIDSAGNAYVSGYTQGALSGLSAGGYDAFIAKYDTTGNLTFKQFGTAGYDSANGIAIDNANNVYVTGSTEGVLNGKNAGGSDVFIAKYDSTGNLTFKQFGTSNDDEGRSIAVNQIGLVSVVGTLDTPQGDTDGFLKLSSVSELSGPIAVA